MTKMSLYVKESFVNAPKGVSDDEPLSAVRQQRLNRSWSRRLGLAAAIVA
jgi:hypothetical protein